MSSNKRFYTCAAVALMCFAVPATAQGIKDFRKVSPIELMPSAENNAPKPTVPTTLQELQEPSFSDDEQMDAAYSTPAEEITPDEEKITEVQKPEPVTIPADTAISVMPATNISLDTLGIYNAKSGGLAFDVWDGTDYARARDLLAHLPQTIPTPAVRQLVARLLLTSARPPQSDNIQQNIFAQRIEALMHIDEVEQAQRLVEMVPQNLRTESIAQMEYTAHLLKGDSDWVCSNIGTALQQFSAKGAFWQKLSIYCHAKAGEAAKAQLTIDMLSEQQVDVGAGFLALMDVMLGRSKKVTTRFAAPLSLSDAALIAVSGQAAFPENYLDSAPLPIARLVAENEAYPNAVREAASKRLRRAIAVEELASNREDMREWFGEQFDEPADDAVNFDRLVKDMQSEGKKSAEPLASRRQNRLYSLLQALGFGDITVATPWDKPTFKDAGRVYVAPQLRGALAHAVDSEKTAESILLLAIAVGQVDDLGEVDDASIADMVQALMQLGFEAEAKALAAEAMTALY